MASLREVQDDELRQHNQPTSSWIALHGRVYDVTTFAPSHPGGASILHKFAGKDATEEFDQLHSRSVLDSLPDGTVVGTIKPKPIAAKPLKVDQPATRTISVGEMICNKDFVPIAQKNMSEHGWIYYSTGAEDEETLRENEAVFRRYIFRPRVCVDVSKIDMQTTILGFPSSMPLFLCGAALQGLAHPDGEVAMCKAAFSEGVIQMVPTFSSKSLDEIAAARAPGQVQFFQLYINSDRSQTEKVLKKVEALGFKAVFVTVDAPKLGRRERDMRMKYQGQLSQHHDEKQTNRGSGVAMALNSYIAANVTWADITWIKNLVPKMKIVVKGIQRADDAVTAATLGVDGLLLSNHGGRQIDTGRSGVEILVEVAAALRERGLFKTTELYVDGGVWRGNDIAKCIALGARAVGVGRATIFGLASFGQVGAEKSLQIFKAELQNTMGLLGSKDLQHITPDMVMERSGNSGIKIISRL